MLKLAYQKAIITKTKAMFGKRLSVKDYKELIRKKSVTEIATYLKSNTSYKSTLVNIDELNIHRGQLEQVLRKELFNKYISICKYTSKSKESFYSYIIIKSEIQEILRCIMLLNSNSMHEFILDLPSFLIQHSSIDLISLAKVRTFKDLQNILTKSNYKKIIDECSTTTNNMINYTLCEVKLRQYQYNKILEIVNKEFRGSQKIMLINALSYEVDLLNLSFIIRLKKYFNLDIVKIKENLLPFHNKLTKKKQDLIIESKDKLELLSNINKTFRQLILTESELDYIEHYTHKLKYKYNKKLLYFTKYPSITFYSFFCMSEQEIENIIKIIESIRYNVSPELIEPLVIN